MKAMLQTTVSRSGSRAGNWLALFPSLGFALLMISIPWEKLRGRVFEDKEVYLEKFLYLESVLEDRGISNFREFFFNEALWDLIVRGGVAIFGIPVSVLLGYITFLCLFVFARFLICRHGWLSVIFLLNPMVVDFAFSQLRMAFAVSIVLFAFTLRRRAWLVLAVALACFIHTAILLLVVMYVITVKTSDWLRRKRFPAIFMGLLPVATGICVALLIGPFREGLLSSFEDRRAEYELAGASLLYASFWIGLLAVLPLQKQKFLENGVHLLAIASISTFVSATFLGVFGARFISATYPLIISSMLSLGWRTRQIVVLVFFFYTAIQWYYWFQ